MRVKIYCPNCKSEAEIEHEMDTNYYLICHCSFCGEEIDEDLIEDLDDEEREQY
jgi:uncharacterized Zn finger protein